MQINRAYKYELDLNNVQRTACLKHAGAARFAFNWGLRRKKEAYAAGEKTPTAIDLHRELNVLKQSEIPWMYEVSKCAPQEALRDLDREWPNGKGRWSRVRVVSRPGFPRCSVQYDDGNRRRKRTPPPCHNAG